MSNFEAALFALSLDRHAPTPLHEQLEEALRDLILSGQATPGARLPASRVMAAELSVSRITVLTAVDQLIAEGYLETRRGAGTYVAADLPDMPPVEAAQSPALTPPPRAEVLPLRPGLPDLDSFPHGDMARLLERVWRHASPALTGMPDPLGWMPLRAQIAAHLRAWRGIEARPEQVIITSGAVEGFELILRGILPAGGVGVVEDPVFQPMLEAFRSAGLTALAHPVDAEGLDPLTAPIQGASVCIVTPSRQYPTGATLPLQRRLALLEWAQETGGWIVEDDYDGEFRYRGKPLPALASLDRQGRVFYMGSFSKLLSPSLRLGYVVCPETALPALTKEMQRTGARASVVPQPAVAAYMESGAFSTHLRRMRRTYAARQVFLQQALKGYEDWIIPQHADAGMHLCCQLGSRMAGWSDQEIANAAKTRGLGLKALSTYSQSVDAPQGLLLGFAGFDEEVLRGASQTLTQLLQEMGV
jgi:GntR family transcriptional regulator/MocR family aminotransferase